MKRVCVWGFVALIGSIASAEPIDLIVRMKTDQKIEVQMQQLQGLGSFETQALIPDLNIHRVRGESKQEENKLLLFFESQPSVRYVQRNHRIKWRQNPNDSDFHNQWSLNMDQPANIGIDQAWQYSHGGKNKSGEDVVVAIVDGGFGLDHPDLAGNLWVNQGEKPNNNLDDDRNGYVDDIHGWDGSHGTGILPVENHGTHVAGIIAARGDNGAGICGINWESHLMLVSLSDTTTADAIGAYGYVLKQKKLYLQSKGKKGANVVVTNSSFGIDAADCNTEEFPVWTDLYNQMGAQGILSAIAVPNEGWNIDQVGDVPSACPSDFIISVTNIDETGMLSTRRDFKGKPMKDSKGEYIYQAGFGLETVDIGAPGDNILSTVHEEWDPMTGNQIQYAEYSGTSMATPHVAGTVGLMMAAASEKLLADYKADPATTALLIKEMVLESSVKTGWMSSKTKSGGQLNAGAAVRSAAEF